MSKFDVGDGYLTRGGLPAGVVGTRDHERIVDGWIEFPDGRSKTAWHHDGRMHPGGMEDRLDLMPRPERTGPVDTAADRLDKLEAMCTDLFRQLRGVRATIGEMGEHRVKSLDERIDRLEKSRNDGLATLNNGIDDLRQRIEGRFAKMDEEQAREIDQINERMESGRRGLIYRLDTLDQQMTAALGITIDARPRPATPVEQAINALHERLEAVEKVLPQYTTISGIPRPMYISELERSLGERVGALEKAAELNGKVTMHDGSYRPTYSKPTIKGGWVNVYRHNGDGRLSMSDLRDTLDEALATQGNHAPNWAHVNMVQIPDITEGEGL